MYSRDKNTEYLNSEYLNYWKKKTYQERELEMVRLTGIIEKLIKQMDKKTSVNNPSIDMGLVESLQLQLTENTKHLQLLGKLMENDYRAKAKVYSNSTSEQKKPDYTPELDFLRKQKRLSGTFSTFYRPEEIEDIQILRAKWENSPLAQSVKIKGILVQNCLEVRDELEKVLAKINASIEEGNIFLSKTQASLEKIEEYHPAFPDYEDIIKQQKELQIDKKNYKDALKIYNKSKDKLEEQIKVINEVIDQKQKQQVFKKRKDSFGPTSGPAA
jgi:hypothetical protein